MPTRPTKNSRSRLSGQAFSHRFAAASRRSIAASHPGFERKLVEPLANMSGFGRRSR